MDRERREAISRGRKGKGLGKKSPETVMKMTASRQRKYILTSPMGTTVILSSHAIKVFCQTMNMSYSSLMRARCNGTVYRGWKIDIFGESNGNTSLATVTP